MSRLIELVDDTACKIADKVEKAIPLPKDMREIALMAARINFLLILVGPSDD